MERSRRSDWLNVAANQLLPAASPIKHYVSAPTTTNLDRHTSSPSAHDLGQQAMLLSAVHRHIVQYAVNQQLPPWMARTPITNDCNYKEKCRNEDVEKTGEENAEEGKDERTEESQMLVQEGDGLFTEEWFCSCFQLIRHLSVQPPPEVVALLCHIYIAHHTQVHALSRSHFLSFLSLPLLPPSSSSSTSPSSHLFFVCPFVSALSLLSSSSSSLPHCSLQILIRLLEQHIAHPSVQSWLCESNDTATFCGCVLGKMPNPSADAIVETDTGGNGVGTCCLPRQVMHSLCDLLRSSLLPQWFSIEHVQIPFRLIFCVSKTVQKVENWRAFMSFVYSFLFSSSTWYMSEVLCLLSAQRVACPETENSDKPNSGNENNSATGNSCVRLYFYLSKLSDLLTIIGSLSPLYYSDGPLLPPLPPPLDCCASPPSLLVSLLRTFLQLGSSSGSSVLPVQSASPSDYSSADSSWLASATSISSRDSSIATSSSTDLRVRKCWALSRRVLLQSLCLLLQRPPADVSPVIDLISSLTCVASKLELVGLLVAATNSAPPPPLTTSSDLIVRMLSEMHRLLPTVEDGLHSFSPVLPQLTDLIVCHLTRAREDPQQQHKVVIRALLLLCASSTSRVRSYGLSIVSKMLLAGLNARVIVLPLLLAANSCRTNHSFSPPPASTNLLSQTLSHVHFFSNSHCTPSCHQRHLFHAVSYLLQHPSVFVLYVQFLKDRMLIFLNYCRALLAGISSLCSSASLSSSSLSASGSFQCPAALLAVPCSVSVHHLTLLLHICPPRTHSEYFPESSIWETCDILFDYAQRLKSLMDSTAVIANLPNECHRDGGANGAGTYLPRIDEYVCVTLVLTRWYSAVVGALHTTPQRKQQIGRWLAEALRLHARLIATIHLHVGHTQHTHLAYAHIEDSRVFRNACSQFVEALYVGVLYCANTGRRLFSLWYVQLIIVIWHDAGARRCLGRFGVATWSCSLAHS
eukprot:GHVS01042461.1.p1 GENE.GHVS01042461.1~~GHVS01042461.1.p1  ORF type:complete len:974 (+),score=105.31 GHVS01042461.1:64-2985(+)